MKAEILQSLKIESTITPPSVAIEHTTVKKENFSSMKEALNEKLKEGTGGMLGTGFSAFLSVASAYFGAKNILDGAKTGNVDQIYSGAFSVSAGIFFAKSAVGMFHDTYRKDGILDQITVLNKQNNFQKDFINKKKGESDSQISQIPHNQKL